MHTRDLDSAYQVGMTGMLRSPVTWLPCTCPHKNAAVVAQGGKRAELPWDTFVSQTLGDAWGHGCAR